jgi:hypothetical protein
MTFLGLSHSEQGPRVAGQSRRSSPGLRKSAPGGAVVRQPDPLRELQTGSGLWLAMKSLIFCATDTLLPDLDGASQRDREWAGGRLWAPRAPPWRARGLAHCGMSSSGPSRQAGSPNVFILAPGPRNERSPFWAHTTRQDWNVGTGAGGPPANALKVIVSLRQSLPWRSCFACEQGMAGTQAARSLSHF